MAMSFPVATKREPVYQIDGALYQRVSHTVGQQDPSAIRAMVQAANGEHHVKWFAPFELPAPKEQQPA